MTIAERLHAVQERVRDAAADRPVQLVAVSKGHPAASVREAYEAGQRVFGESYAQEFAEKAQALADLADLEWRFIGHLQRNKTKLVLPHVHAIDSVDSVRLAERIATTADRPVDICLQVNVADEPQKSGVTVSALDALVAAVRALDGLRLRGLMTVPPADVDPTPVFRKLKSLATELGLEQCSMGMSGDLESAIAEGSTHVRVGTAIFGPRP